MRKSILTATALATVASFAAAPVAPAHSSGPVFKLDISGQANGYVLYHGGQASHKPADETTYILLKETVGGNDTGYVKIPDNEDDEIVIASSGMPYDTPYLTNITKSDAVDTTYIQPSTELDAHVAFNAYMSYEGMTFGAYSRFDAPHDSGTGDRFYVSLGFDNIGTFFLGAIPGAGHINWISMPGAGAYTLSGGLGTTSKVLSNGGSEVEYSEKSNKLMFETSDMGGLVITGSWTPFNKRAGKNLETIAYAKEKKVETNIIELQGKFTMDGLKIGAGFATQEPNGASETKNSFNVLASYETMGIELGAGYIRYSNFSTQPSWSAFGGMQYYVTPAVSFGAGYLQQSNDHPTEAKAVIIANVKYKLASGASWQSGAHFPTSGSNWSIATGLVYEFSHIH